ncbi:unnamed protein product [Rotaria sp. Silwood2]|nr:unnamed protein product [Rotaria sp. Silwood2]CAF3211687.1 unnamed protein product [Rotaria sp. Silwood2]CAF3217372.1 unnamed protein product [Rotaria sp. Silwood2]CAF4071611.1 unnamed protein product [Rotaria sp. Silwood2]CAF4328040.1 unnamed protein product [Rotaria sp. Silwood2]
MGDRTSCHHFSSTQDHYGCISNNSNSSVLTAGAIIGIIIGSLVGIAIIIALGILIYKLSKRNKLSHEHRHMNIYGVPMNMHHDQYLEPRSDIYLSSKPPLYSETTPHDVFYEYA